ncbi:MAG: NADPH-dependent glutamate synthase [Clostridia bacterium]|jgi:glutamate synthase (NADPH/NADH) small chain|nr:NADPH-dependent glutamate synthase [Clostridia bacterium]
MAKVNTSPVKNPMPMQDPVLRARNFDEVTLGYDEQTALAEAMRCLGCKNSPCVSGCPVGVDIPAFIAKVKEGDFEGAYEVISRQSSLPAVCGRVCPQETQCEAKCVRGIKGEPVGIGRLERFVADWHNTYNQSEVTKPQPNGHRVAVVGSGPAGLACAGDLAKLGYEVTVFEALHVAGGVLMYGIPEFRLPKKIVQREVETLRALGVRIETNVVVGRTMDISDLFDDGFEAVFIGSGAGLPSFMGIPGESLKGVYSANEYLTRSNLMKAYRADSTTPILRARRVAVVGGGNVAMDAARTALRLGAEKVYIVYRRSMEELPSRREEVEHAMEEGVEFLLLQSPTKIHGYVNPEDPRDPHNGFVDGMTCIRMELGEPDEHGRRKPLPIPDSEYRLDVDCVIMAIGTTPNPLLTSTTKGLETNKRGCIITEESTGHTTLSGVWAGGDAVTGAATVILAMGAGKLAAKSIDESIRGEKL